MACWVRHPPSSPRREGKRATIQGIHQHDPSSMSAPEGTPEGTPSDLYRKSDRVSQMKPSATVAGHRSCV